MVQPLSCPSVPFLSQLSPAMSASASSSSGAPPSLEKLEPEMSDTWMRAVGGKMKALKKLAEHAISDPMVAVDLPGKIDELQKMIEGGDTILRALDIARDQRARREANRQLRADVRKHVLAEAKSEERKKKARERAAKSRSKRKRDLSELGHNVKAVVAWERSEQRKAKKLREAAAA